MIEYLENNRKFALAFTIFMAVEIFVVSSIPGNVSVAGGLDPSLIYHFVAFFLLNFFLIFSITNEKISGAKSIVFALIISLFYAILDEIHQFFVPLRSPDILDVLIDSTGILASTLVYLYYRKSKQKTNKNQLNRKK